MARKVKSGASESGGIAVADSSPPKDCMFDCAPPRIRERRVRAEYPITLHGDQEIREDGQLYRNGVIQTVPASPFILREDKVGVSGERIKVYSCQMRTLKVDAWGAAIFKSVGDLLVCIGSTSPYLWQLNKRDYVIATNAEKMVKSVRKSRKAK